MGDVAALVKRPKDMSGEVYVESLGVKWYGKGAYIAEEKPATNLRAERFAVRENDLVYNDMWARNGSVAIIPPELDGYVVSAHFPTWELDLTRVHPPFFGWCFQSPWFWNACEEKSQGSTGRNAITKTLFRQLEMPLPPLDEQRRIVARIEALAARIEEARGLRQGAVEGADNLVSSLHNELAAGRTVQISEILALDERPDNVEFGSEYPQVGVKSFGNGLFPKESVSASQTSYRAFNRLYAGAVVLSQVKGWEGAIAVCPPELDGWYVSPEYRTFSCIPGEAIPDYLASLIPTPWFWSKLKNLSRGLGGRRERTRPEQFLALELPMPTIEQQKKARRIFNLSRELKPLQSKTATELDALLPSILDRAFRGEL